MSNEEALQLLGPLDRHRRQVEERLGMKLSLKDSTLRIQGEEVEAVAGLTRRVEYLLGRMRKGSELSPHEIGSLLLAQEIERPELERESLAEAPRRGGAPEPRTENQRTYLESIRHHELVLASGPAGTGKTFLAVAAAVQMFQEGKVRRLVFTRPAVEAGERLGFLPGDFEAKVDPYLRPLYDALGDIVGLAALKRMKAEETLEIAPIAFMRGRTLNRSFVILDEAQNATVGQMKMVLTRLGEGTKAVVTGDRTQTDLPGGSSGLDDAVRRLRGMDGVAVVEFGGEDIQRSPLVQRIVDAYGAPE